MESYLTLEKSTKHIGTCEFCGKQKEYKYKSHIKRFCSHKCSNQWKWETKRDRAEARKIICKCCKKEFIKPLSFLKQHPDTKYCSRECMGIDKRTRVEKECETCGKIFETTRASYCSRECGNIGRRMENPIWEDKDFIKEYNKTYNTLNKDKINRKKREYNKTEKGREGKRLQRLKRRASGTLTTNEVNKLVADSNYKCYWCNTSCEREYHLDHYTPVAKGGKTTLENMVVSCPKCNRAKSAKDPLEFAQSIGKLF